MKAQPTFLPKGFSFTFTPPNLSGYVFTPPSFVQPQQQASQIAVAPIVTMAAVPQYGISTGPVFAAKQPSPAPNPSPTPKGPGAMPTPLPKVPAWEQKIPYPFGTGGDPNAPLYGPVPDPDKYPQLFNPFPQPPGNLFFMPKDIQEGPGNPFKIQTKGIAPWTIAGGGFGAGGYGVSGRTGGVPIRVGEATGIGGVFGLGFGGAPGAF